METNNEMIAKFNTLWNKGYSMGDIAWMLDISIVDVGKLVNKYYKENRGC